MLRPALVLIYASSRLGCDCILDDEERVRIPITEVFDLHAVEPREVAAVVEAYLEEAARLGLNTVRIIHGRGIGVQRGIVRAVLARAPFVVSYRDAPPRGGRAGELPS
jgi:dsDNA-specific endonuclease/ATPase MutS2